MACADVDRSRIHAAVRYLAVARCHRPAGGPYIIHTPYHRALDAGRLADLALCDPIGVGELGGDQSLVANRLLASIYETDMLFLPEAGLAGRRQEFLAYYDPELRVQAEIARTAVESFVFDGLERSVPVSGHWSCFELEAYIDGAVEDAKTIEQPILRAIEASPDRRRAAELVLCQLAVSGLTTATPLAQNLGGAYGTAQSQLAKIYIEEAGHGVFDVKLSTLFGRMCASVGMSAEPHSYWFFYLPAWLARQNYLHRMTRNRAGFFRFVGATAYRQATAAAGFAALGSTLLEVYGDEVDICYCDEQAHTGRYRGELAVANLLLPLARQHGPAAIRDMVHGIEEMRHLDLLATEQLAGQVRWNPVPVDDRDLDGAAVRMSDGMPFETRMAEAETVVSVRSGSVELYWSPTGGPLRLGQGQAVRVPAGRLYGLRSTGGADVLTCVERG